MERWVCEELCTGPCTPGEGKRRKKILLMLPHILQLQPEMTTLPNEERVRDWFQGCLMNVGK